MKILACPGRCAARSDALQTRDPGFSFLEATGVPDQRCTARKNYALHRVRDTSQSYPNVYVSIEITPLRVLEWMRRPLSLPLAPAPIAMNSGMRCSSVG